MIRQVMDVRVSNKLTNMSLVCSLLVVLIHVWQPKEVGSFAWWIFSLTVVRYIAVPYFFFAAGYLLGGRMGEVGWWRRAIAKRTKTLLVPYVCWSVLWMMYLLTLLVLWNIVKGRGLLENYLNSWVSTFCGWDLFRPPHMAVLWFVRTLMLFVLVSPLLKWLMEKCCRFVLLLTFVLSFNLFGSEYGEWGYFLDDCIGLKVVFYFLLGIALRMRLVKPMRFNLWVAGVVVAVSWLAEHLMRANGIGGWYVFRSVDIAASLIIVWRFMPENSWPQKLTSMSFPIYMVHWFYSSFFASLFYNEPQTVSQCVFRYLGMIIPSMITILLLRKLPSRWTAILFGNR